MPRPVKPLLLGGLALLAYAAARSTGLWALGAYAEKHGLSPITLLTGYDAVWYESIATRGYDTAVPIAPDGGPGLTNLAFFPLYPGLVAWAGGDPHVTMVVVAAASGLLCAAALYAIGAHLHSPKAGIILAALWGVLPHAVVQSMGYSESLFTALAAWTLYAVLRRNWLLAAVLCVLAGLTRPTGIALVVAVGLAGVVAGLRDWRAWVAVVVAPLGTFGFVLWLNDRIGRPDAYTYIQSDAWNNTFDGGQNTVRTLTTFLRPGVPLPLLMSTVVLLVSVILLIAGIGARVPWPMLVFAAGVLLLTIGSDHYYWAKGRLLIPAFPLLIPLAIGLARSRSVVAAPATLLLLAAISGWYGIFVLTQWPGSP